MAFDGITVAGLRAELEQTITGGRIYKIAQTDKNELVITVRPPSERGGGQLRLYLCADPSLPLIYLTGQSRQAPLQAPAFCMLLRKHLQNGRIVSVTQPGLERILRISVEHRNEMGDLCTHVLVIEIMGKHSNIIFLDEEETIVDSIRHVSSLVSSVREVLPGRTYFIPDTQSKKDPLTETREGFLAALEDGHTEVARHLVRSYTGFSPVIAQELSLRAQLSQDRSAALLSDPEKEALWQKFFELVQTVREGRFTPVMYCRPGEGQSAGAPVEFSMVPLQQYADCTEVPYESPSSLLEDFYARKNLYTRIRQRSADLRHIVQTILERDVHKYDLQCRQIKDTEKREKYKIYGELLNAYGYSVPAGAKSCELDNYYTGEKVRVPLDPTLTPQQNAQKYFDRYARMKRTNEALTRLTVEVRAEIDHLRSIQNALEFSTTDGDLSQIRREMEESGFLRRRYAGQKAQNKTKKGRARVPQSLPLHYVSSDGYDIYVGKNNTQNDEITFHMADGHDIWFHANDMPGSHVLLKTGGKTMEELPDRVFEEAASLAAYYSSGRAQGKVEIDYLERRNVKKPSGAAPGFVVYYTNYSILAKTDISALREVTQG
ncbi:MAG: NFACT RNA binding domain-containing protein [Eubacteriales bacterium]|nr:NFACT RNA binding domain-containing protein [Eubacteriales bacterium]